MLPGFPTIVLVPDNHIPDSDLQRAWLTTAGNRVAVQWAATMFLQTLCFKLMSRFDPCSVAHLQIGPVSIPKRSFVSVLSAIGLHAIMPGPRPERRLLSSQKVSLLSALIDTGDRISRGI